MFLPLQDRDVSSNGAGTRPDAQADLRQEAKSEPQKIYNENAMNVVLVGSECAPWSKTGDASSCLSSRHILSMQTDLGTSPSKSLLSNLIENSTELRSSGLISFYHAQEGPASRSHIFRG